MTGNYGFPEHIDREGRGHWLERTMNRYRESHGLKPRHRVKAWRKPNEDLPSVEIHNKRYHRLWQMAARNGALMELIR